MHNPIAPGLHAGPRKIKLLSVAWCNMPSQHTTTSSLLSGFLFALLLAMASGCSSDPHCQRISAAEFVQKAHSPSDQDQSNTYIGWTDGCACIEHFQSSPQPQGTVTILWTPLTELPADEFGPQFGRQRRANGLDLKRISAKEFLRLGRVGTGTVHATYIMRVTPHRAYLMEWSLIPITGPRYRILWTPVNEFSTDELNIAESKPTNTNNLRLR